jgi:hypothetical protein
MFCIRKKHINSSWMQHKPVCRAHVLLNAHDFSFSSYERLGCSQPMVHQYKILDVPNPGTPIFSQDTLIASQVGLLFQNFLFQLAFSPFKY